MDYVKCVYSAQLQVRAQNTSAIKEKGERERQEAARQRREATTEPGRSPATQGSLTLPERIQKCEAALPQNGLLSSSGSTPSFYKCSESQKEQNFL